MLSSTYCLFGYVSTWEFEDVNGSRTLTFENALIALPAAVGTFTSPLDDFIVRVDEARRWIDFVNSRFTVTEVEPLDITVKMVFGDKHVPTGTYAGELHVTLGTVPENGPVTLSFTHTAGVVSLLPRPAAVVTWTGFDRLQSYVSGFLAYAKTGQRAWETLPERGKWWTK